MANSRDVTVNIDGNDNTGRATRSAADNLDKLDRKVKSVGDSSNETSKKAKELASSAAGVAVSAGRAASTVAALASVVGPAAVGIGALVTVTTQAATTAAALAPVMLSAKASMLVLKGAAELMQPALEKAFAPGTAAAKNLQKSIGAVAADGVPAMTKAFLAANLPGISDGFERIATSTNKVILGVGRWLTTSQGVKTVSTLMDNTASATERLVQPAQRVAIAFAELIASVGKQALGTGVGWLEKGANALARWAENFKAADAKKAMQDLEGLVTKVTAAFGVMRDVGRWMGENTDKVKKFSDAVAAAGLVVGALTGNWVAVGVSALTLLSNHWDGVKKQLDKLPGWYNGVTSAIKADRNVQDAVAAAGRAIDAFKAGFLSQLGTTRAEWARLWADLKKTWSEVGPTVTAVFTALRPVLAGAGVMLAASLNAMSANIRAFLAVVRLIDRTYQMVVTAAGVALGILVATVSKAVSTSLRVFATLASVTGQDKMAAKLRSAADSIDKTASSVVADIARTQAAINGLHGKTVTVTVRGYVDGKAADILRDAGNANQREGRGASFATGRSFAAGGSGQRTGGPAPVFNASTTVFLDGREIAAATRTVIDERAGRDAWRARVGRR